MTRLIKAPRGKVYRALLDPGAIARWRVPDGITCEVHEFDAREGGLLRVSLTYDAPTATGKTVRNTDTYCGRFVKWSMDRGVAHGQNHHPDVGAKSLRYHGPRRHIGIRGPGAQPDAGRTSEAVAVR
jgi:hypothetical protein